MVSARNSGVSGLGSPEPWPRTSRYALRQDTLLSQTQCQGNLGNGEFNAGG